jgi:hypothetical protein
MVPALIAALPSLFFDCFCNQEAVFYKRVSQNNGTTFIIQANSGTAGTLRGGLNFSQ